jgi:hypothetical protein
MDDCSKFNSFLRFPSSSTILPLGHIISTVIWGSERTISHAPPLNPPLCPVVSHIWIRKGRDLEESQQVIVFVW